MIWILLGLIVMAIFTANITSALTALSLQQEPSSLVDLQVGLSVVPTRHSFSISPPSASTKT